MLYFELLCQQFKELPEIQAIVLGGSRAGKDYDEKSDYDLYLYCSSIPDEDIRKEILENTCQYYEIGNAFWELEDDCTLKNGIDIDILYRNLNDFSKDIASVVDECQARTGYTTCMWHNLINSTIIYDVDGAYKALQEKYTIPYPAKLKSNIVAKNIKLLTGMLPSYDGQILKAAKRQDIVSVNHRISAFIESYFDIIFALNEMTHPGEKRMIQKAIDKATILPANFEDNIKRLLMDSYTNPDRLSEDLKIINDELSKVIK